MLLELLPEEVLTHIISYLAPFPRHSNGRFRSLNLLPATVTLISLGLTCSLLRKLCARYIFGFVSLVRVSQLDAILNPPRSLEVWSNSELHRNTYLEVLSHRWSLAVAVSALEIPALSLYEGDLLRFSQLEHLTVLGNDRKPMDPILPSKLTSLAINCELLMSHAALIELALRCTRLDLVIDFRCSLNLDALAMKLRDGSIRHLNLFVSDFCAFNYTEFTVFLRAVCGELEKLALRVFSPKPNVAAKCWTEVKNPGDNFLDLLKSLSLECLTVELGLLRHLNFSPLAHKGDRGERGCKQFILVDRALCFSKYMFDAKDKVWLVTKMLLPKEVHFVYGAMGEESQIIALGVVCALLDDLALHTDRGFQRVQKIALEKAWLEPDERHLRAHYEALQALRESLENTLRAVLRTIVNASALEKNPFTSPRFRRRELYDVTNGWSGLPVLTWADADINETFWDVETCLRDLVHYATPEKPRLRLWD